MERPAPEFNKIHLCFGLVVQQLLQMRWHLWRPPVAPYGRYCWLLRRAELGAEGWRSFFESPPTAAFDAT